MLKPVDQTAGHGILGCKQEREYDHGHLEVAKFFSTFISRVSECLNPFVQHALWLSATGHRDFAVMGGEFEPPNGNFTSLDRFVNFGSGQS